MIIISTSLSIMDFFHVLIFWVRLVYADKVDFVILVTLAF